MVQMVLLTFFGAELREGSVTLPLEIITIVIVFLLFLYLFKEKIHKILIHDLKLLEKSEMTLRKILRKELQKTEHDGESTHQNKTK